jgi:selenocysteine lyase/cysteine desulfurase
VEGLRLYVAPRLYAEEDRIGTFPFSLEGYHHALLASILEVEYGIEVRAGTICNHRLVRRWFGIADDVQAEIERRMAAGDRLATYGVARASVGLQTGTADIDALADALVRIREQGPRLRYRARPADEAFEPIAEAVAPTRSELTPIAVTEERTVGP